MSLKAKKKRRRLILLGGFLGAAGLLVAVYFLRLELVDRQLVRGLAVGREALAAGDYVKALDKIGRYAQRHDADAAALYDYAQARERVETPNRRHVGQAIRVYGRVLDLEPEHAAARSRLLDLYLQSGFNAETIATAEEVLRRAPDDPSAHRAKAIANARLRNNEEALRSAERYNELAPLDLAGQVMRMQLMLQGGRPAADVWARAASLAAAHPDDARFQLLCSIAASMTGDEKAAGTWARRAAAHGRPEPDLVVLLANQLSVLGMYDEALGVLRRAADANPVREHVAPLVARLWEAGQWAEVEARLATLPPADADATELLAMRAMSLAALGRRTEVDRHLAVLAARPLDPAAVAWARVLPGAASVTGGGGDPGLDVVPASGPAHDLQAAADRQVIEACEAALRQQPGHPYFHYFLGEAYARIGDADLALEHWQLALPRAPAWSKPVTRIAWALVAGGRPAEARDAARVAVDRAPRDAGARAVLAWAWSETLSSPKDAEALLTFVAETRSLAPADEQAPVIAAAVLAASGRQEQAVTAIRDLIARDKPLSAAAFLRLAEVSRRAKLGLEDECFDRCRRAHGSTPELALAEAASLLRAGRPEVGLRMINDGAAAGVGEPRHWQVARAQFLEAAGDASAAGDAWVALADSASDDVPLLWSAFASSSLADDRDRRGLILERLRRRVGDLGINWRLRRAEFLLHDGSSPQELDEAAEILGKVTLERPRLVQPRLLLADALSKAGKAEDAIEQLAAVVHLQPTSVSAPLELAELLQGQGEFGRAKEHLRVLLGGTHADARDRQVAASLLARQGESGMALGVLQQLLKSGGGQQVPALLMASLHRAQGQPAEAEAIYRKLLETPDAATIQEAASFYASTGRVDDARGALAQLETPTTATPALKALVLGNFEASYGDPRDALRHFEAAVAAEPGAALGWQQLIAFHVATADPGEAAKAIDRAVAAAAAGDDPALRAVAKHRQLVVDLTTDASAQPLVLALLQPDQAATAAEALSAVAGHKRDPGAAPDQLTARLAELAAKHPRLLALQSFVMRHYAGRRQFDQAIAVGTRTMHLLPAAAEPARLTAEALASAGRWQEALGAAERWRERSLAQPLPADMLTAAIYLRLGRPADATARLDRHLTAALADPDAGMPLILLSARAKIAAGRVDDAVALVRPLLPRSRECRLGWAELAAEPRAQAKAGAWLEELATHVDANAVDEVIGVAQAWRGLSRRTGDPAHAEWSLEWLRRAERLVRADAAPPAQAGSLLAVAVMREEGGDTDAAAELYRRALARDPELPLALNNLAMIILNRGGDNAEAASLAERAVRLAPEVPNFHDTLAAARSRAGQYDQAITSLTTATRLDPSSAKWRINLAEVCIATGRIRDARVQLDEVEAGHPNGSGLSEPVRQQLRSVRTLYQGKVAGAKQ